MELLLLAGIVVLVLGVLVVAARAGAPRPALRSARTAGDGTPATWPATFSGGDGGSSCGGGGDGGGGGGGGGGGC